LCRNDVDLAPTFLPARTSTLYASCDAKHAKGTKDGAPNRSLFRRPGGSELETSNAFVAAAFSHLCSEWPCAVAFEVVLDRARRKAPEGTENTSLDDQAALLSDVWTRAYKIGFLQLHVVPPRVVNKVSPRPECSKLARFQLSRSEVATSQLHKRVRFKDVLSREVAQLLDGTRDDEAVTQVVLESIWSGQAELRENNARVTNPGRITAMVKRQVRAVLKALAREGLLLG
jgi:methyltransferase-like protein